MAALRAPPDAAGLEAHIPSRSIGPRCGPYHSATAIHQPSPNHDPLLLRRLLLPLPQLVLPQQDQDLNRPLDHLLPLVLAELQAAGGAGLLQPPAAMDPTA